MPKWSKVLNKYKVKVQYRKDTATTTIPKPILEAFGNPKEVIFSYRKDIQQYVIQPV